MFVRLTFCKFAPGHIREVRKIYHEEIVPRVKRQKGNLGVRLLEPKDKSDDFISVTEWKTRTDADTYESSGLYKKLLSRLSDHFVKEPQLKIYRVEEVHEAVDHL